MSRAFMKEADAAEPGCPACGAAGDPVGERTLEAFLTPELRAELGAKTLYCPAASCPVVYFNGWGATVKRDRVKAKDPEGPICPCFGVRAGDVVADAQAGRKDRLKAWRGQAEGPEARCAERCPDGRPCAPRVLRLFREHLAGG